MAPKEKAEELVKKYVYLLRKTDSCLAEKCENTIICQHSWYACEGWLSYAKECATFTVDEIIKEFGTYYKVNINDKYVLYWEEVKQEIEKL